MNEEKNKYEHLLYLPHFKSKKRKPMSMTERAAQFGAFRPLTGYEEAISETGRLTSKRIELDEYEKAEINSKLRYIGEHIGADFQVAVTYFVPDKSKPGGEYMTHTGTIRKIRYYEKQIVFADGKQIDVEEIVSVECDLFCSVDETSF